MSPAKAFRTITSAFIRRRSFGYETRKELRYDSQAFSFDFKHHFKTTSTLI